jgi:hypothetical protein
MISRLPSCLVAFVTVSVIALAGTANAAETGASASASMSPSSVIYAAAGAGSVLDKAGGPAPAATGSIHVALPLLRYLAVELMGSAGYVRGDGSSPDDMWMRLALGARVEDSRRAFRPYGALRFVHIHYATAETWKDHPADSFLGSSAAGLQHRSGMAGALGLSWLIPHTDGKLRAMAEVELAWVPIGTPPAWAVTSEIGLGVVF